MHSLSVVFHWCLQSRFWLSMLLLNRQLAIQMKSWNRGRYTSLHTSLHSQPQQGPTTPLGLRGIAALKLELRRSALAHCTLLCLVTHLVTQHSHYIPRYRPNPSPGLRPPCHHLALRRQLQLSSWSCGGVLCVLCVLATFERELLLFCVVLRCSALFCFVLLILMFVKKCFPVTDLHSKDLRYRTP